jgi:nucleoside-diphosphate-sugar epimerase
VLPDFAKLTSANAMNDRRVLVTGAAGCLGGHLVRRLLEQGFRVDGLDTTRQMRVPVDSARFELHCADIRDADTLSRLCAGAEFLFHTAAVVGDGYSPATYRSVNVEGTRTVAKAALAGGVRRLVHVSSVITYGFEYPDGATETSPLCGTGHPYAASKIEGERVLRETISGTPGAVTDFVILRAGDIYGPAAELWTVEPLRMMQRRMFFLVGQGAGAMNHVYVENLVDGILLAAERAHSGEIFNIVDGCVTLREFFERYAGLRRGRRLRSLPVWLFCYLTWWYALASRLLGKRSVVTPGAARFLMRRGSYSAEKARRVLGYEPARSLDLAMSEIDDWARATGLIEVSRTY